MASRPRLVAGAPQARGPLASASGGTIHSVSRKTTIYLPDDLKRAIEREARRQDVSEAEVIRRAVAAAVSRPRPTPGVIDGPPIAGRAEELLAGFGAR